MSGQALAESLDLTVGNVLKFVQQNEQEKM
jgi:hypothetical protein